MPTKDGTDHPKTFSIVVRWALSHRTTPRTYRCFVHSVIPLISNEDTTQYSDKKEVNTGYTCSPK